MKLIVISAVWCPACLIMNNRLNKMGSDIEIIKYDYDTDIELIRKYNVGTILPVLILMDNDKELGRLIGEQSIKKIERFIDR